MTLSLVCKDRTVTAAVKSLPQRPVIKTRLENDTGNMVDVPAFDLRHIVSDQLQDPAVFEAIVQTSVVPSNLEGDHVTHGYAFRADPFFNQSRLTSCGPHSNQTVPWYISHIFQPCN
jgi:hypothetical protein